MERAMSEKGSGTDVSTYGAQPASVRPGSLSSPRSPRRFSVETRRVLNALEIRECIVSEGRQMTRHGETLRKRATVPSTKLTSVVWGRVLEWLAKLQTISRE